MKAIRQRLRFSGTFYHLPCSRAAFKSGLTGFVVGTGAAALITALLRNSAAADSVPLLFLMVVAAVAHRFGTPASIFSLLGAALVFATYMFPPLGHVSVGDSAARSNMVMMLLFGVAVAYFYGREQDDSDEKD